MDCPGPDEDSLSPQFPGPVRLPLSTRPRHPRRDGFVRPACALLIVASLGTGCAALPEAGEADWPRHTLTADRVLVVNTPPGRRVDTSGLLALGGDRFLTVDNLRPDLFTLSAGAGQAETRLVPAPEFLTPVQLGSVAGRRRLPYDLEGLARDAQGRLYLCDEAQRWVLRLDPASGRLEALDINWTPARRFFSEEDRNASFEGIAVGGGRLYLANERTAPAILVVDLQTLQVVDTFQPRPFKGSLLGTHYSDLCWFEDRLWVLCRQHRVILQVNPATQAVEAEYDYEQAEEGLGYRKSLPAGIMEGLAVEKGAFWLITDNNGWARSAGPKDLRPTLLRCPRPPSR